MLYMLLDTLHEWHAAQGWEETPAYILSAKLLRSYSKDSTTYRVKSRYRYTYRDQIRHSEKVSFYSGSDNIGDFHQRTYAELTPYIQSGKAFRCYVNPEDPAEAVLFLELRTEMLLFYALIGFLFGGVGFGILFMAWRGSKLGKQQQALIRQYPNEPWMHDPAWQQRQIASSDNKILWGSVFFALFWNLISAIPLFLALSILFGEAPKNTGQPPVVLLLIFPVVGLGLAIWAVRNIVRHFKFGRSTFEIRHLPGVIGGVLSGTVHVPVHIESDKGFEVMLTCVNRITKRSGKKSSVSESILWQDRRRLSGEMEAWNKQRSVIPVFFEIPEDVRESNKDDPRNQIIWRLQISAEVPGVDFNSQFEVPVFKTAKQLRITASEEQHFRKLEIIPDADKTTQHSNVSGFDGIHITALASGGKMYDFPAARNPAVAVGITGAALFVSLMTGGLIAAGAPLLFPIIFGIISVAMVWAAFNSWFMQRAVLANKGQLTLQSGLFTADNVKVLPSGEISGIFIERGAQVNDRIYYRIIVRERDGKKHTAATGLSDKQQADILADDMMENLF